MYLERLKKLQPRPQLRRELHRRHGDEPGPPGRLRDCGRPVQGAPPRHPLGRQGHHRRQGLPHDMGIGRLPGTGPRLRRHRHRVAPGRRRRPDRQTDNGRVCRWSQLVRRPHQQSMESRTELQRVLGRSGFGNWRWMCRLFARHRNQRVYPGTFFCVRRHGIASHVRDGAAATV